MCFLRNCDPGKPQAAKPSANHQSEIYRNLWSLAALLAPVSFVLDDAAEINALIRDVTRSAKLEKPRRLCFSITIEHDGSRCMMTMKRWYDQCNVMLKHNLRFIPLCLRASVRTLLIENEDGRQGFSQRHRGTEKSENDVVGEVTFVSRALRAGLLTSPLMRPKVCSQRRLD